MSDTTARQRRDEWLAAGIFDAVAEEAMRAYDRIIGLDLSDVAVDGSLHKSPCGGEGTGKNPTDQGKLGWKWSILTDRHGIPIGWTIDGANRNDSILLAPTLDATAQRGLLAEVETIWLDRGFDSDVTRQRLAERNVEDTVIAKKRTRDLPNRRRRTSRWDCVGRSSARTRGCRTSGSCDVTLTASPSTGSLSSHSPSPASSPRSSSTGESAGHRTSHLSAEPLSTPPEIQSRNYDPVIRGLR